VTGHKEDEMFQRGIRAPIWALVCLSLGGALLHLRIHPPADSLFNCVPTAFAVINVLVLPFLFNNRRTVAWAYLLNAVTVVVGTVTMAYFSITHWKGPVTVQAVLLQSTLPDIIILAAKLPLAHIILRHFRPAHAQGGAS
jgi:hypothetical protein